MSNLIVFVLAIAMCFGLNEGSGCALNTLKLRNELGRGSLLKIDCTSNQNKKTGPRDVRFNQSYAFDFEEVHSHRIVWACHLRHGPKLEYHQSIWRAYRGAATKRCGQTRTWIARPNGIYMNKNFVPQGFRFAWLKR
ncbi:hypothetical protein CARUB_v10021868mg [Capsella rubella]|uniref:Uncharacterized protein n=1 Tax=Capsella rubella TaxID=81985 RepID=R0I8B2_9BRAS|nr:hypothetical protein CARUB_v10021868mg [Capsella rubella]